MMYNNFSMQNYDQFTNSCTADMSWIRLGSLKSIYFIPIMIDRDKDFYLRDIHKFHIDYSSDVITFIVLFL